MSDPTISGASPRWEIKHGFIALAVCVLCAEGVAAGIGRSCMPAFDLGILFGQLLLLNMFFAPETIGIVAGIPAFIVAGSPGAFGLSRRRLPLAFAGLGALAIVLAVVLRSGWSTVLFGGGLLAAGALIGFCVRAIAELRRFWLPTGILLALIVGGIIFMFGHYGQNNCWP
jgi:hypothetical protein